MRQRRIGVEVLLIAVALVVGLVGLGACGGDDDGGAEGDEPAATTTTVADSTTTTVDAEAAEEAAVREARQAADQAWIDSTAPPAPDPDAPAIAETHVGPMLEQLVETARGLERNGWAIRYPENSQYEVDISSIRFSDDDGQPVAFLEVCTVDDGERIVVDTGEVLAGGVRTIHATEAMRKVDGVWKLAERREDDYQEGVAECAGE
jgi:hypothetical protein